MLKPVSGLNLSARYGGYAFQVEAVETVKSLEYSALFHEQGLGKTKIGLDLALEWIRQETVDCVLIVTKRSLIENWSDEIESHTHLNAKILGQNRKANFFALNSPARLFLAHYEVVRSEVERLKLFLKTRRVAVILDEAQKIKNPDALLTKAFHSLSEYFSRRVIMTGTPVANRPEDIWAQIFFLDRGESLGGDFERFQKGLQLDNHLYADRDRQFRLATGLAKVFNEIRPFTVRETKDTAGIELPEKVVTPVYALMEPRQRLLYDKFQGELGAEVTKNGSIVVDDAEAVLKRLLRLVQVASNPKLVDAGYQGEPGKWYELCRLIQNAEQEDSKVIVWTAFVENTEWLCRNLRTYKAVQVHGELDMETRNRNISRFKRDESVRILVATPGAAKEGLTLTMANHAVFYDRSFSLDDYLQAQDRIHRISQTRKCHVWNLMCCDTIDLWVDSLLSAKRLAAQLMQADISREEYENRANYEFGSIISEILNTKHKNNHDKTTAI